MYRKKTSQFGWAIVLLLVLTVGVTSAQEKKRPDFTVIYLQNADAREAASSLETLLDGSPDFRRIVADPRTNALFVSANEKTLSEIEQFLKIIDQPEKTEPTEVKVFALKNIRAADAEHSVITFAGPSVRIASDTVTNSLIISGQKEDVVAIQALLQKLDESSAGENRFQVAAFELEHVNPQKAVGILNELRTSASIAVDESKGRLLVSGEPTAVKNLQSVLEMVDTPDQRTLKQPVQLRLVWLMEDKQQESEPEKFDADLAKVVRLTETRLGLSRLKKVMQLLVNVEPDSARDSSEFSVSGETELDVPLTLDFRGQLTGSSQDRPTIGLQIAVGQSGFMSNGVTIDKTVASIDTKVTAPVGHSVVLGVTSINSTSSVFVLQILPADAEAE